MEVQQILQELENEIARLKEVRALLAGDAAPTRRRGRPPRLAGKSAAHSAAKQTRGLSAAGRRRISEALKRRWAERRKEKARAERSAKAA